MSVKRHSDRIVKDWLELIDSKLQILKDNSFRVDGMTFATSAFQTDEPFVWRFLIVCGVLTFVGRLDDHFVEDKGEYDLLRGVGRDVIFKEAVRSFYPTTAPGTEPRIRSDARLLNRTLYLLDTDRFDIVRHWTLWAKNDKAELVSELTIMRRIKRRLRLTNATAEPDERWDQNA